MNDSNQNNKTVKNKKAELDKIPKSKTARGLKLAGLSAALGSQAITGKLSTLFSDAETKAKKQLLTQLAQAEKITQTLSQMKGAAMKVGQLLSMHADDLFPKEVVTVLSKLQNSSTMLKFEAIEPIIQKELKDVYKKTLIKVNPEPMAAASIGQVHEGEYSPDGKSHYRVALKIQYPGVGDSIDSDVDSLASLLSVLTKLPNTSHFVEVIEEIKTVLHQETNYKTEAENLIFFAEKYKNKENIIVPRLVPTLSTEKILTTEIVSGLSVQQFAESTASQESRNYLGKKYLEIFYTEVFELGLVQTDPNLANYLVQWSFGVQDPTLVLLDFGATKKFSSDFRVQYKKFMQACLADDYEGIKQGAIGVGFLREDDSDELVKLHYDLIKLFMEPFEYKGEFPWGETDLASRIRKFMPQFVFGFKLRPPPRDFVFLNRKVLGVYFFCSAVGAKFDPRPILEKYCL